MRRLLYWLGWHRWTEWVWNRGGFYVRRCALCFQMKFEDPNQISPKTVRDFSRGITKLAKQAEARRKRPVVVDKDLLRPSSDFDWLGR